MADPNPLSQAYSTRRDMPYPANASTADLFRSFAWLLYSYLSDQNTSGTLGPVTRPAGSIWTVVRSCDGSGAAPAESDLLGGGTFNAAKWVFNGAGSNHTWVVLRNASAGMEVLIDLNSPSAGTIRIAATPTSAPFSAGSATLGPTSTGEFTLRNHSVGTSFAANLMADTTTGGTNYAHGTAGADGTWHFGLSRAGLGYFTTFFTLQRTADAGVLTTNWLFFGGSTTGARGYPVVGEVNNGAAVDFRLPSGALFAGTGGLGSNQSFGGTGYVGSTSYGSDSVSGKYPMFPIQAICLSPQVVNLGRLADVFLVAGVPQVGLGVTESGVVTRAVVGDFIVPFNGGAPTV